jgi:eukaryotic-like serine/threonine-protein kinase
LGWDTLIGQVVGTGWLVVERKIPDAKDTGNQFSIGFFVEKDGRRSFMKVFEIDKLMKRTRGDPRAMSNWLALFSHECKMLEKCLDAKTKHVITVLERGKFHLAAVNPSIDFEFIILERAETDLRRHFNYSAAIDLAFALMIAKHMAYALYELHNLGISHQDMKPSNVMLMDAIDPKNIKTVNSKIGDLGSSSCITEPVWHDALLFCGDPAYAPPEVLYGQEYPDWHDRRIAKDLWLLGSLIVFLITKVNLTAQMMLEVPAAYHPGTWADQYQYIIPVLRSAQNRALNREAVFKTPVGKEVRALVQEICDPDPLKRGSPRVSVRPQKYSMQRYGSILERLVQRVLIIGNK